MDGTSGAPVVLSSCCGDDDVAAAFGRVRGDGTPRGLDGAEAVAAFAIIIMW